LDEDTATLLLGLEGVAVAEAALDEAGNPVLALVTAWQDARCCPSCGMRSTRSLGLVITRPRDLPLAGRPTVLAWTKRRRACGNTACARASFTESVPQIPPRTRLTGRLRSAVGAAVADGGRTVIQSARDHEVSWPTAHASFAQHAASALPAETPPVEHLGIDEIRRGKPRYRQVVTDDGDAWEVTADRWHVGFCDLSGGAGLLGQVEGRTAATASAWLDAQTDAWRAGVRVAAIDMCTVFKAAVRESLPHAVLVVDRFHLAQLATPRSPSSAAASPSSSAADAAARAIASGNFATGSPAPERGCTRDIWIRWSMTSDPCRRRSACRSWPRGTRRRT